MRIALLWLFFLGSVAAQTPAPSTSATIEQRLSAVEAYLANTDPAAALPVSVNTQLAGPGHNAWMMTSAALVLFMTLPGLALFYGGLVRRKNILSVMAQCLGCAGLVTILWWLCGFSFAFAPGSPFLGGLSLSMLK